MEVKKKWDEMNYVDKEPFIERAKYLIDRGYYQIDINILARTIYEKSHKKV